LATGNAVTKVMGAASTCKGNRKQQIDTNQQKTNKVVCVMAPATP